MDTTHYSGLHLHWFWIVFFLFMVLMCFVAARRFRRFGAWRDDRGKRTGGLSFGCWPCRPTPMARWWSETPDQILNRRYASGEITKEQYEQMRHDIGSSPLPPGEDNAL